MGRALRAVLVSLIGLTVLAVGLGFAAVAVLNRHMAEPGPLAAPTEVEIERGMGLTAIAERLAGAGAIDDPRWFALGARLSGRDRGLQAGEYALPAAISPQELLDLLQSGEVIRRRFTAVEGQTVREVFDALAATEGLSGALPDPPPEGSLLPETYFFSRGETRESVVARMRTAMDAALDEVWAKRPDGHPLDRREDLLTLASIVQEEAGDAREMPVVAAVFLNRLERGMRLQSDPTVIYGLTNGETALGRPLYRSDWQHDSPYNTYRIDGLPPTPIANPGRAALDAVMAPAEVDYLYFVADGTGGHAFARTLNEHNRNVAAWRRIKRERGIE